MTLHRGYPSLCLRVQWVLVQSQCNTSDSRQARFTAAAHTMLTACTQPKESRFRTHVIRPYRRGRRKVAVGASWPKRIIVGSGICCCFAACTFAMLDVGHRPQYCGDITTLSYAACINSAFTEECTGRTTGRTTSHIYTLTKRPSGAPSNVTHTRMHRSRSPDVVAILLNSADFHINSRLHDTASLE